MSRGILFLISAPSGAGKTSLVKALVEATEKTAPGRLCVSVSHTTRPKRPREQEGLNYHFVTRETFQQMRNQGDFLEHAEVFGNFYGTSKPWVQERLDNGQDVILEIDWQGAAQVQALMPDAVGIFILPPSLDTLRQRLTSRGQDDETVIEQRMAQAVNEISHYGQAAYLVINDHFDTALADLAAIFRSARLGITVQQRNNKDLLDSLIGGL